MTYFVPGSATALSNFGNGDIHLFLTGGKQIFGRGHWLSGTGFRLPEDRNWGTQMWYWSNQWDYELPGHIYPLIGLNWFHWMDSAGAVVIPPVTGLDLINLPTSGIAGSNVVTNVIGARWKPGAHLEMGFGWEYPLTQNGDFMRNRVYTDVIVRCLMLGRAKGRPRNRGLVGAFCRRRVRRRTTCNRRRDGPVVGFIGMAGCRSDRFLGKIRGAYLRIGQPRNHTSITSTPRRSRRATRALRLPNHANTGIANLGAVQMDDFQKLLAEQAESVAASNAEREARRLAAETGATEKPPSRDWP